MMQHIFCSKSRIVLELLISSVPDKFLEIFVEIPNADHEDPVDVHGRGEVCLEGGLEAAHVEDIARQGGPTHFTHQVLLGALLGALRPSAMAAPANGPSLRLDATLDATQSSPVRQRRGSKEEPPQDMAYYHPTI